MEALMPQSEEISLNELIQLTAVDSSLFAKTFFPKAARHSSPSFDKRVWASLDDPRIRFLNQRMFRGSAKTTRGRIFTAKRIAYGISRTILYVGASEPHASRSIQWLRAAVEHNAFFRDTFALRPGRKWHETEIEIFHGVDERPIWVLGVGITGNIRGINFDDYRPDLIFLDDVITDENAATLEQREKINDLVLSALKNGLASEVDEPNAKMIMQQTPIHREDASAQAAMDEQWHTDTVGCWTPETAELPLDQQVSAWEEMFPTATLRADKLAAIKRNKLSLFTREMECRLVSAETSSFRPNWLRHYENPPKGAACILIIDPVPPPTERQLEKNLLGKDYESICVVGRKAGEYYVLEYRTGRGHDPNWTVATALELAHRWRVMRIGVIAVGYEAVLENLLRMEMMRRRVFHAVTNIPTRSKSKFYRILAALSGPASQGMLWCHPSQDEFISQFTEYGPGYTGHDDVLETVAAGVQELASPFLEFGDDDYSDISGDMPNIQVLRRCP
jgi:hypothetical protein